MATKLNSQKLDEKRKVQHANAATFDLSHDKIITESEFKKMLRSLNVTYSWYGIECIDADAISECSDLTGFTARLSYDNSYNPIYTFKHS
jgi:hypothetical protein